MSLSKKKLATLERKSNLYKKLTRETEREHDILSEIHEIMREEYTIYEEEPIQDKFCK